MRALPSWVKGFVYSFLCIFTLAQTGFGQGPAAASAYGKLPLSFEPNQGQTAGEVQFLSRGRGYTLFLSSSDSVLALHRGHRGTRAERMEAAPSADTPAALRMRLVGANRSAPGIAEDALPGKSNYLIGNDRSQWRTDVPNYGRVRYRGVYPGIDLAYYGNQRLLEHDFEVAPGADPRRIRLAFDGIKRAVVEKSGDLVLHLADGEVRLQKPLIYQNTEQGRREVTGGFVLRKSQVTIQVGSYDRRRALVIDPVLSYSTYLGGTGEDAGSAVATDSSGNVYVVGKTASIAANGFPINSRLSATGCAAVPPAGCSGALDDVFITKINPAGTGGTAGTALVYSTFLGGNGDDEGYGISVDSGNNAYVTGYTSSSDFPLSTSPAPFQATLASGLGNAFVSKINSAGNALLYSTYLGGTARDWGSAITQDSGGNIYLTGQAYSRDFPTLSTLSAPPVTVFASRTSGTSWAAATSGITSFQITAFAVDGNTPGTVYAGQVGSGVIKSTDFGATWTAPEPTKSYTSALILDRTTTGAAAVLYEGSRFGGVRKITVGGTSSTFINSGLGNTNVLSLVQDATSAGTLYAGTNGSGVWVNTTINTTPAWSQKPTTGLGDTVINALAVDVSDNLYAGTNSGVYELASGAVTWTTLAGGPAGFVVTALAVDSSSNVYAATFGGGLFKLSGGAWTALNGSGGTALGTLNLRAVAVDPVTPSTIYAAGRSRLGIYKSTDGGATWSLLNSGLTITSAQALAIDPAAPANVYAGMVNLMSFVAKFNSGGSPTALAFFGGGSGSTQASTIAVDNPTSQNMYIAGPTSTATLPTPLVGQTAIGGNTDGFVAKISTVGTPAVVWDRYLGGAFDDVVYSLALDQNGNVDVTGYTTSADFPVTPSTAFQTALKGTPNIAANAFVAEINPGGDTLLYSTYFGGTGGDDEGTGIAVVSTSSVPTIRVTNGGAGYTSAPTVTVSGGGGSGATAIALAPSGGQVTGIIVGNPGSGYISAPLVTITGGGGTGATAQAVLSSPPTPLISVAGLTFSTDLPTVNATQSFNAGGYDTFYARFDPSKSGAAGLRYSTYLGGNSDDFAFFVNNLALDSLGSAWITGQTFSTNFPTTAGSAVQPAGSSTVASSSDAFVYKIQTTGNSSDVAIAMSSPVGTTPAEGTSYAYSIVVTDNGPSTAGAPSVTVTGTIPSNLTVTGLTTPQGTCPPPAQTFACNLGTVFNGAPVTIAVTVSANTVPTPPIGPTMTATVQVSTADDDPVPANNSASTTVTVQRRADLTITGISSPASVTNGTAFNYSVTAANNGPSTATGIIVSVPLSATFTVVVTPAALGTLTNTANVAGNEPDLAPGNNSATSSVTVVTALADVAVTMTAAPSPVAVLGSVTYQITLTNNGPSTATGVVLTDTLPAGTLFAAIDDLTHCAVSNGVLTCNFASIAAGSNITVNLILVPLTVPAGEGTFANTATVAASELDPVLSNNSATQTVQVTGTNLTGGGALRNLSGFSKTITPPNDDDSFGPVPLGFNLNFFGTPVSSLFVNNNGNVTFGTSLGTFTPFPITTTNLQIIAPYFSDVETFQTGSGLVTYGNDTVNGRPAFGVNWPNVDYFGEGEPPTLLNLFQLVLVDRSDVNAGDFDIELNYDKIQWETGDASGGSGGLGGTPARVGYSNGTGSTGSYFEFPGSGVSGSFLDSNLATGLIYNTLNSTQPGRYVFQVRGGVVQSSADLSIAATGPQSVVPGSTVTYSITAANLGPNTATGVTVTDALPVGLTFVSTTQGTICPTPPTPAAGQPVVVTCNVGSLASGSTVNIAIQASVPSGTSASLIDTAVVSVPNNQDLNLGNNTATVVTNTNVADVAVVSVGAASPVGGFPAYAATVINNGPATATNVVLTDALDNFGFVSASSAQGSCTFTSPTVTCNLGTMASGASAVVTVVVTAPNAGWAANTYHVSAVQPDPNPINNAFRLGPSLDSFNTPLGSNVAINTSDPSDNLAASLTFTSVTRIGSTTMTSMSAASLPAGFRSGRQPAFFDISTNAEFAGAIGLNIRFLPANFRHPALVRLFHFEGGVWVDRTMGLNVSSGVIAGQVMSLSPFALLEPVDSIPIANAGADRSVPGAMAAGARVALDGSASADADADPLTYRWSGPFPEGGGSVTGINPTVTLPLGVSKVALVVNDGEADSPAVAVNIAVADFQVSAPAGSVALARGQSASFTITMTPQYGAFGAPINLSCAPGAADVTCSFSSASVTPGATAAAATLTVTAASTVARAPRRFMPASFVLWFGTLPVFGVVFLAAGRRRKWQMAVLLILLLILVASHIGCGGGGTSQTQSSSSPSTPGAKAISITVTGTSGTLQHSSAVTVTIPQ